MDDLISRKAALNAVEELDIPEDMCVFEILSHIEVALGALPSVQPKIGKWIVRDNPGTGWYRITCSECGEDVTSVVPTIGFMPNVRVLWNFCPECGAKMEG